MKINLTKGLGEFEDYKAWKFPGGELDFTLKNEIAEEDDLLLIETRINSSDDLILLCIVVDGFRKRYHKELTIIVSMPYMPYQQADRDFGWNESFALKTVCKILNSLEVDSYVIFDAHSDVAPGLLNKCLNVDNSEFIENALSKVISQDTAIMSPDAGAAKKIFKLADKLGFDGEVLSASKSRNHKTGEITTVLPDVSSVINSDIFIIDDICVGGRTFIQLAEKLRAAGCTGKLYLAVSHGIFSNGLDELLKHFEGIFTTDSKCEMINERLNIFKV